jgi:precorrin-2/cobalt-factor-2 C20-methyltransferase
MHRYVTYPEKGHFYALGVGPGAPDLLTIRAVNMIKGADVIICPCSARSKTSLALEAIKPWLDRQEIVEHVYPMDRDEQKTWTSWEKMASLVVKRCNQNQTVVQVTLGDPLVYSTSCYLLHLLSKRMHRSMIHVVPGITAFQAVSAKLGYPLTMQEDRLLLVPGTDMQEVEKCLTRCETLVLYKVGKKISELYALLKKHGLEHRAKMVCYVEQEDKEFVCEDLAQALKSMPGYLATVIVNIGRRKWNNHKRACDHTFST